MAYRPMTKEEVDAEVAYLKSFTLDKPPSELGVNPTSYIDMQVRRMYALGFTAEALAVLDFHGYTKSLKESNRWVKRPPRETYCGSS